MAFSVLTSPSKAFEDAFANPHGGKIALVVLLTALVSAASSFLFLNNVILAGYFFVSSVISWFALTLVVWFFEFVHIKRRKGMLGTHFVEVASATAKLWTLNLAGAVLMLIMVLVSTRIADPLLTIVFFILIALMIIVFIGWLVASAKLLKFVTGSEGAKLLINWIILIILNAAVSGLLMLLVSKLFIF